MFLKLHKTQDLMLEVTYIDDYSIKDGRYTDLHKNAIEIPQFVTPISVHEIIQP